MMENDQLQGYKKLKWYQKCSVEPTMFFYMFAFMFTSVVEQAFFVRKSCLVNNNYTTEICDNLDKYPDLKKKVQITTSNFHQFEGISAHIFPIILALFLGAWSDKRGRKFPLLIGLTGKFIYSIMIIVNDNQPTWPVEYIIYTATIPCALTGADVAIFASCFAYISDISSVSNRTMRVTILEIAYLIPIPTGVALGSYLFNQVLNKSYTWMFAINATLVFFSIIYSFAALKWQTTPKQRSLKELNPLTFFKDFFDIQHVKDSFYMLVRKRESHRRLYLALILLAMAFYTFVRDEKPYVFLYTQFKYNWTVQDFSNYKTFQSTAYVISLFTLVPLMNKVLKWRDTTILYIGCTAHAIARIFYVFAENPTWFYVASVICSIGPICGPVLRSITSKIVPISERGKVFAIFSVCDNAVPFISSVIYTQVYNATIDQIGGIFLLSFAAMMVVIMLNTVFYCKLGKQNLASPEQVQEQKQLQLDIENNMHNGNIIKIIKDEKS